MQNKKMLPLTDRRALVVYLQEMRYRRIAFQTLRYAYNMDGIDDRWTLANRAINIDADFDIAWSLKGVNKNRWQAVIAQNIATANPEREFSIEISSVNHLVIIVGGISYTRSSVNYAEDGNYRLTRIGSTAYLYRNGVLLEQFTLNPGAAREPLAVTTIGCRLGGSSSAFSSYFKGIIYDVRISNTLWPMADRNQTIQPSIPAGNNMTGTNLNPDRWVEIPK